MNINIVKEVVSKCDKVEYATKNIIFKMKSGDCIVCQEIQDADDFREMDIDEEKDVLKVCDPISTVWISISDIESIRI